LQAGTAAADHRDAQRSVGTALFLEERHQFARCIFRHLDQAFIADLDVWGCWGCGRFGHRKVLLAITDRYLFNHLRNRGQMVVGYLLDVSQCGNVLKFFAEDLAAGESF